METRKLIPSNALVNTWFGQFMIVGFSLVLISITLDLQIMSNWQLFFFGFGFMIIGIGKWMSFPVEPINTTDPNTKEVKTNWVHNTDDWNISFKMANVLGLSFFILTIFMSFTNSLTMLTIIFFISCFIFLGIALNWDA